MATDWIMMLPTIVYSRIVAEFSADIKAQYKMTNANFSSVSTSDTPSVFPFVYVNGLPASEVGQDLEATSINGGLFTFQVDVYDNASQQTARAVMGEIVRIMKRMRFDIVSMPSFESADKVNRCTARFRRVIGAGDIL